MSEDMKAARIAAWSLYRVKPRIINSNGLWHGLCWHIDNLPAGGEFEEGDINKLNIQSTTNQRFVHPPSIFN